MKNLENLNRASAAAIGFTAASLIFIALALIVKFSVHPPALDQTRVNTIAKSLAEIQKTEDSALTNADWVDQARGIVRLPIETAMQMAERSWQNPAAARADLTARAKKAAAPLPKQPAKPNPFE
jgi:hypothetical protein